MLYDKYCLLRCISTSILREKDTLLKHSLFMESAVICYFFVDVVNYSLFINHDINLFIKILVRGSINPNISLETIQHLHY